LYACHGKESVLAWAKWTDAAKATNQIHELFEIFIIDCVRHKTLDRYSITRKKGFMPHVRLTIEVTTVHLRRLRFNHCYVEMYLVYAALMSA